MGIGTVKTATIADPLGGYAKYAEQDPSQGTDATIEALTDTFDRIDGTDTLTQVPSPTDDPFLALRFAVEGNGGATSPSVNEYAPIQVPTMEELVAIDPTLNSFADGTVDALYANLHIRLEARKVAIDQSINQGVALPAQLHAMQELSQRLSAALVQLDDEQAKAESLKTQAQEIYDREIELLKEVGQGTIDPEDADLNNDGVIGNFKTSDFLIGYQMIDDEKITKVLHKETMQPVTFDPVTFLPTQGGVPNSTYTWTVAKPGVVAVNNAEADVDTDITLQLSTDFGANGVAGNSFGAPIDLQVPEYLWVERDAKHPDQAKVGDDGGYVLKPLDGLIQTPPNDAEFDMYMQVKVTDMEVKSERPIDWPGNNTAWNPADGYDHLIVLAGKDGLTAQIRIKGRVATAGESASSEFRYVHHDFVAASSVGIAFSVGSGDMARRSAINFTVDSNFVSTNNQKDPALLEQIDFTKATNDRARRAMEETVDKFTKETSGYSVGPDRTGVFVTGLHGNLKGSSYNDVFIIPDAAVGPDSDPIESVTTLDAGDGYNLVKAGTGDHYINNATFIDIAAGKDDKNYISHKGGGEKDGNSIVSGGIQQVEWDPETGTMKAHFMSRNPAVYIRVDGGDQTHVMNPKEISTDGTFNTDTKSEVSDDYYDISSGFIGYTNPFDWDINTQGQQSLEGIAGSTTDGYGIFQAFNEMKGKVDGFIHEDPTDEPTGETEGGGWEVDAEYYNKTRSDLDGFFQEWATAHGLPAEGSGPYDGKSSTDEIFGS